MIHIGDGVTANLIVGETGRWTTSGILRDVRSDQPQAKPEQCDFAVAIAGGMGMPGPGGPMGSTKMPSNFEKVFENDYGTLYRNPAKVEHSREPLAADVSFPLLAVIAIVGFSLLSADFLLTRRPRARALAAGIGTLVVACCFWPLTSTAIGELRNPPAAPPRGQDGPPGFGGPGFGGPGFGGPGFGGPGFGGPGFGGPGFGGPGFGPGPLLGDAFLREADTDKHGKVSLQEFKTLAGRWFAAWDVKKKGRLELEEFSQGLQSVLGPPPGMDGAMPMGPPGFGPETFLSQRIFSACDANGDGKLTREEMVGAFEKWFHEWDTDSKGSLDAAALGSGLERIIGPPPMF